MAHWEANDENVSLNIGSMGINAAVSQHELVINRIWLNKLYLVSNVLRAVICNPRIWGHSCFMIFGPILASIATVN